MRKAYSDDRSVVGTSDPICEFPFSPVVTDRLDPAGKKQSPCELRRRTVPTDPPGAQRGPSVTGKRYTLTTKDALWSDEPAKSGMAPLTLPFSRIHHVKWTQILDDDRLEFAGPSRQSTDFTG